MKKIGALLIAFVIAFSSYNFEVMAGDYEDNLYIEYDKKAYKYTAKTVDISINGVDVETGEMPAIILNSSTMVPAREVFESSAFKASVEWNGSEQEVYITYADKFIVLKINSTTAYVNNVPIQMNVPAKLIRDTSKQNAKTMIPLRFVSENLGFKVDWDNQTYTAIVTSNETPEATDLPTDGEQLDQLTSDKAKNSLPTLLSNAPIEWISTVNPGSVVLPNSSEITEESNAVSEIQSVKFVEENGEQYFKIASSGPITYAKTSIWDGKYIVDISNSLFDLDQDENTYSQSYSNNPLAYSVRASQYEKDAQGRDVTRVVFVLKNPDETYNLTISPDRKTLMFELTKNKLYSVKLGQSELGDYIVLNGSSTPKVNSFRLSNPDRIVFDLPDVQSLLGSQKASDVKGQYITAIRTAQFDSNTARVVVETEGQADYKIEQLEGNQVMIRFVEPTYDNIIYEHTNTPVITLENSSQSITIDGITYEDRYYDREYIIHLPGDYQSIFGAGGIQIKDDVFDSIEIVQNANGNTDLVIKEKEIYEFRIESDENNVYIKAYKPKELYSKILVVDLGHGGTDPGAIDSTKTYYEKNLNFAMGMYLKALLDVDPSIKVYYTRRDDTFISLQERVAIANEVEADIFVSIHNNSFTPIHNGTETLYFKDVDHPGLDSIELAKIIHDNVIAAIGLNNRGIKDRNDLYVIKNTNMPATIVEVGFMSSAIDLPKITQAETQQKVAQAIYNSIVQTFEKYPTGR